MTRKRLLVSLPAAAVFATAGVVRAFNPQPEPPAFGMVSLARTQTAVLHVVLAEPTPEPWRPACHLELSFMGADGQVFHDAAGNGVRKAVALQGNVADSLTLRSRDILGQDELRKSIRAVLTQSSDPAQPPDPLSPNPCKRLIATLEIVSPFGFTQLLYVGQPPDPLVPEGVTR